MPPMAIYHGHDAKTLERRVYFWNKRHSQTRGYTAVCGTLKPISHDPHLASPSLESQFRGTARSLFPGSDRWQVITVAGSTFASRNLLSSASSNLLLPSLKVFKWKFLQSYPAFYADDVPEVTLNAPSLRQWISIDHILPSAHSSIYLTTLDFTVFGPSRCFCPYYTRSRGH